MTARFLYILFFFVWFPTLNAQEVIGVVKNAANGKPITTVHVLNLNKVVMSITNSDGVFVIPDKSHNVLIDHFANGGVFAGIVWIAFVILVFVSLFNSLKKEILKIPFFGLLVKAEKPHGCFEDLNS